MSREINLASYIDHTNLKPDATIAQLNQLCEEALEYNFASVCLPPSYVSLAFESLQGSSVNVCTVIGFPWGYSTTESKVQATQQAILNGATEIDMVINNIAVHSQDFKYVSNDIQKVLTTCKQENAILKVIIETALLSDNEKVKLCEICANLGVDYVKTSTGFSSSGATINDVSLMRKNLPDAVKIKASGGIRTKNFAIQLINAGADRLGCSSGIQIINEK